MYWADEPPRKISRVGSDGKLLPVPKKTNPHRKKLPLNKHLKRRINELEGKNRTLKKSLKNNALCQRQRRHICALQDKCERLEKHVEELIRELEPLKGRECLGATESRPRHHARPEGQIPIEQNTD